MLKRAKEAACVSILVTLILVMSAANMVQAVGVIATIPVGTNPEGVAYDSGMGEIFVANSGSNTVSVISDTNDTVVATLATGFEPACLAYDSAKGEIFVTNEGANTVSVLSDESNRVVSNVTVGTYPDGIAYDSGKGEVFVANWGSNTVSVISDKNNMVVATVPVGTNPVGVAYDSSKGEVYVTNSYWTARPAFGSVSVISDRNNKVVATVQVQEYPYYPAYDFGRGEIFVPNYGANTVSVISDKNHAVVANVTLFPGGGSPYALAYDSGKGVIFCTFANGDTYSTIKIISDSSNAVIGNVTEGLNPYGKWISSFPFLTSGYQEGNVPHGITYDSATGAVFVANNNGSSVSVISDASLPSVTTPPTASLTPSPTVPELGGVGLILVIAAVAAVILCAFAQTVKQRARLAGDNSTSLPAKILRIY